LFFKAPMGMWKNFFKI